MKKKVAFGILALVMCLSAALSMTACDKVGYLGVATGKVHGNYLGVSTVKVYKDGSFKDLTFDEIMMPYNWAQVEEANSNKDVAQKVAVGSKEYAKYIRIADKYFEIDADKAAENKLSYKEINGDIKDLDKYVYSKVGGLWYYEAAKKDDMFVVKTVEEGTKDAKKVGGLYFVDEVAARDELNGLFKSTNDYGKGSSFDWNRNVNAMLTFVRQNGFDYVAKDIVKGEDGNWTVSGIVVSGATLTDFKDYYDVMKSAYSAGFAIANKRK